MQLAVIDDLIHQAKNKILGSSYNFDERVHHTLYVRGFIDGVYQGELITKKDYDNFRAEIDCLTGSVDK